MKQSLCLQGTLATYFAYICTEKVCWRSVWMKEQKCWARYLFLSNIVKTVELQSSFWNVKCNQKHSCDAFCSCAWWSNQPLFVSCCFHVCKKFHLPSLLKLWSGWNECLLRQLSLWISVLLKRRLILIVWCKNTLKNSTKTTVMRFVEDLPRPHCLRKIKSTKHPHREAVTGGIKYHAVKTKLK